MVSAPSSAERPAEVFRCPQRLVSCDRAGGDGLPRLGILARWDDCVGATIGEAVRYAKRERAATNLEFIDLILGCTLLGDPAMRIEL